MNTHGLVELEEQASQSGLLLRVQVRRPLNIWAFRLVVAEKLQSNSIQIWGEMKGWAYRGLNGLQLDTMKVHRRAPSGVGHLIWAGTMAWALNETPCRQARLLAILDETSQHDRLVKYFLQRGFQVVREVGSSPVDLPIRIVWGGAGSLMLADCREVFKYSCRLWDISRKLQS